jgi:putative transposon-encoded protein
MNDRPLPAITVPAPGGCCFQKELSLRQVKEPMETNTEDTPIEVARDPQNLPEAAHKMVKFEVFGEEMLEKQVKLSGNSGRIYLPPDWVGHRVKVIRID